MHFYPLIIAFCCMFKGFMFTNCIFLGKISAGLLYIPSHSSFKSGNHTTNRRLLLRNSMFDSEILDRIGYEAVEDVPEKHPLMLHNLSKRLVKAIYHHDLYILSGTNTCDIPKYKGKKFRISKNHKRLNPDFYIIGETVKGRVCAVFPTYALIDIGSTCYGVLHARDMSDGWIDRVDLSLTPGDIITVYIKSLNSQIPTIKLSLRELSDVSASSRRPVHSFKVEERVTGRLIRESPLGFYVDIGATVDAFLHKNDRKLPEKHTGANRTHLKIGTIIPILYIKGVDLIKNRIQLSENSLREELDKRILTGKETPEQQAAYTNDPKRDFRKELRINELEQMKQIGGYDSLLSELGGHRNSTTEYVLYLENIRKQKDLKKRQEDLFQDTSTNEKLQRDKEEFNKISCTIADLNQVAFEPKPHARSIYKYADSCIWNSRIYTPFNESDTDSYFGTITDEITSALRDIQGGNFNFASEFDFTDNSSQNRHKIIEYLWSAFNAPPSELSNIKNRISDFPLVDDVFDTSTDDSVRLKQRDERISTIISDLENTSDPEHKELAEMLKEARDFNPLSYSKTLIDDYESDIKGASALFGEDVSTWTDRARRLVSSNISCSDIGISDQIDTMIFDDTDSIPNIPQDILEAVEDDEEGFVKPIIHQEHDESVDTEFTNKDSDVAFDGITRNNCLSTGTGTHTDIPHIALDSGYGRVNDSDVKRKTPKIEKINFRKLCKVLKKDLQDCEDECSEIDLLCAYKLPITAQENDERSYKRDSSDITDILQSIKELAKTLRAQDNESQHAKSSVIPNYLKMRKCTKETNKLDDTNFITPEQDIHDLSNQSNGDREDRFYLETSDLNLYESDSDDGDTDLDGTFNHLFRSKNGIKQLARFAKRFLSPNELGYIDILGKDTPEEEEFANMMRNGKKEKQKMKYTYYPEGIYNSVPSKDDRTEARKILDSKRRLENLKKNRRFLMMLKRLDVNPENLSFDNILDKLPQQFVFERSPPFEKLKNR